jgi:hypothetical protein
MVAMTKLEAFLFLSLCVSFSHCTAVIPSNALWAFMVAKVITSSLAT